MNFWSAARRIGLPKTCALCGQPFPPLVWRRVLGYDKDLWPTIDHALPKAGGGSSETKNIQWAHSKCNNLKRDRFVGLL